MNCFAEISTEVGVNNLPSLFFVEEVLNLPIIVLINVNMLSYP